MCAATLMLRDDPGVNFSDGRVTNRIPRQGNSDLDIAFCEYDWRPRCGRVQLGGAGLGGSRCRHFHPFPLRITPFDEGRNTCNPEYVTRYILNRKNK